MARTTGSLLRICALRSSRSTQRQTRSIGARGLTFSCACARARELVYQVTPGQSPRRVLVPELELSTTSEHRVEQTQQKLSKESGFSFLSLSRIWSSSVFSVPQAQTSLVRLRHLIVFERLSQLPVLAAAVTCAH